MSNTILMVDSDEVLRCSTIKALGEEGVNTIACSTADDAWKILELGEKVDLVVTSIEIRGKLNGVGLAKLICQHRPGLPVVLTAEQMALTSALLPRQVRLMAKPWPMKGVYESFIGLFHDQLGPCE